MFLLLVLNVVLIVAVLAFGWWAIGVITRRRRVYLEALAHRLSLSFTPESEGGWLRRCFSPEGLRGVYRGHEVVVEQQSRWVSGRLKHLDVLCFACDYPGASTFEIVPASPLGYWVRVLNPWLIKTGDAAFDRFFVLKTKSPRFALGVLDTLIRQRLLEAFQGKRVCGRIRFCDGMLTYAESRSRWSMDAVDRFELAAQRFYELSLAVKVFTAED